MRLLQCSDACGYHLTKSWTSDEAIPPYAVLSHTWGTDSDEVTFDDLTRGTGMEKPGYEKIQFCAEQATRDGLEHFWVDTCCINQADSVELSQAITSMFDWYRNAARCYVYLSDVSGFSPNEHDTHVPPWEAEFTKSKWFTRGWTLQELLAPSSVDFFTHDGMKLGHKGSLEEQIRKITGIPKLALQGVPLSQFSVNERLLWKEGRQTKLEEDKAYSLLGLFGVRMPPIYGEGVGSAFQRLLDEARKVEKCLQDARLTDPRDDKKRIENTKGGLTGDSYRWVLENADFQRWRNSRKSSLLWIKGDPGKGKTMLLCGIIDELSKSVGKAALLSYFFCQATDARINNATAVLRGLIYLLVYQQPSLAVHVRKKHDHAGNALFEDANAWVALSDVFTDMVQDPSLRSVYLIIDALDECVTDLPKLLDFIVQTSSVSSRVKWIMSSRNWPNIEERLERAGDKVRLSLELNAESVSAAVRSYIKHKVSRLAQDKKYSDQTEQAVLDYLYTNANDTFLWAALVCQNLEKMSRFNIIKKLEVFPPGLNSIYDRMVQQINASDDADLCKRILATVAVVYRPVTVQELTSLVEDLDGLAENPGSVEEIVDLCGSLLTIRDGTIYFVHQSAKDFLLNDACQLIFPSGGEMVHYTVFSRSLLAMSDTLRRDIYGLGVLGYPIEQVQQPESDPLAVSRYSCIYWIDHLCEWTSKSLAYDSIVLASGGIVDVFLREKYPYWLEAVSLCKSMSKGVVSMARLEALTEEKAATSSTMEVVRDACRYIMYHKSAIESSPLQAYCALLFSPTRSIIRALFKDEEPRGIVIKPGMQEYWSNCLSTLEGHSSTVSSVAFSHDSTLLASASHDGTVRVWEVGSGECVSTLEGHSDWVSSVAFSHDSTLLASASHDCTVRVWEVGSGECVSTLEGHSDWVRSVAFSYDSTLLASASHDCTVRVWEVGSAFSYDSTLLASASHDCTVRVWEVGSSEYVSTLEGHSSWVTSVAFSHDSTLLASASYDRTIKVWDARSCACLQTVSVEKVLYRISFDPSGNYLHTDSGVINVSAQSTTNPTSTSVEPQTTQYQSVALDAAGIWITYNSQNIVRLPSDYRPSSSAVSGSVIAAGVGNGRVWICEVQSNVF
ncbi:WD40 repeat-like protein [Polyplosphaeria fusca]|uniref:WD40 repeat-like protein n=1 Tax=Polyplosphaeria fusca TaxID=682080 RepID=A0A9P4QNZ0_9PLEO|nr:WD40 repeat-like protein [Polyplosphaeria fusca]